MMAVAIAGVLDNDIAMQILAHYIIWLQRVAQCQTYLEKCTETHALPQNNTVSPMHHYCS
jgi:hypothetical protein